MQLRLGFELDTNLTRATGEALIDLHFSANNGQAVVTVTNIKIDSSNILLDMGSRVLAQPLREMLAQELSEAVNQAIADLPRQVAALKNVQILDVRD
jgi:hypothetical protein